MAEQHPIDSLRQTNRFITDHNAEGLAIFNKHIPETVPAQVIPTGDTMYLEYATNEFPADLSKDLATYESYLVNGPGFTIPCGTVLSMIDLKPSSTSPLHRTRSLDYAVVIEGAVELELDSGEVRTLQRGDVGIQRGTKHLWRNASKTDWARVLFVLQDSKPVEVAGNILEEDYGFGTGDVVESSS
ncbi:putative cupin domain containing protein [Phaeoacremonium minimum UCRPA7]|uniref:Putative cupin domain containing protein n=1 Tax=Phaeoacremonium minimum (strain UCR-PA7) TaxID=1286976 RepID=R8BAH9_PHAM7|nr:putative cupin domain containing protein [Phaeoacremonium minimum UCRPA7]EON96302.1 putative cupin domain containing protein [Phaeoacremonium minimum UCRPA7]